MKTARGLQQSRRHKRHLYGGGRRRSSKAARSAPVSPFQNGTGGISLSLSSFHSWLFPVCSELQQPSAQEVPPAAVPVNVVVARQ
jgi:hypothetical protein